MQFKTIIDQQKAKEAFFTSYRDNRLAHALILKGVEGVGQLAFATAIAQYINCENPTEDDSCGVCPGCSKVSKGIHPDVRYILPIISKKEGGKSLLSDDYFGDFRPHFFKDPYFSFNEWVKVLGGENKQLNISIDEIRDMKRKLSLKAFEAKYKVVIFWNAERINIQGANALLKVLEEPPERTILILVVSDPTKLLTTINSRCQRLQMHRIEDRAMQKWLGEKFGLTSEQALQIAQISEGRASRAVELVNKTNQSLSQVYQLWLRECLKGDYVPIQKRVEGLSKENKEFQKMFLSFALQKLRDSLLFSFQLSDIALATPEEIEFQQKFSRFVQVNGIDEISRLIEESMYFISRNANSQMVFLVLSLRIHSLLTGKVLI